MKLLALFIAILLATPAWAQPGEGPVSISADSFTIDEASRQAMFDGNVEVNRDGLQVWANKVVVEYGEGGVEDIESLVATGNVRLKTADQEATGETATFDPVAQTLILAGNVVVTNASGTLKGPRLTINLADNTTVFSGGGSGGRVTGVFTPQ